MGTLVQTLASSSSTLSTYAVGLATHEGEAHAASGVTAYAWLLVALPLLGAAILLLGGRRTDSFGPVLATCLSWGAFVVGAVVFLAMLGRGAEDRAVAGAAQRLEDRDDLPGDERGLQVVGQPQSTGRVDRQLRDPGAVARALHGRS